MRTFKIVKFTDKFWAFHINGYLLTRNIFDALWAFVIHAGKR